MRLLASLPSLTLCTQPCTYVQKCRQVLFNEYFIFDRVVCRFYITSYMTEFHAFWRTFIGEDNL